MAAQLTGRRVKQVDLEGAQEDRLETLRHKDKDLEAEVLIH